MKKFLIRQICGIALILFAIVMGLLVFNFKSVIVLFTSSGCHLGSSPLENNLSACHSKVQSSIKNLHEIYGEFDIACRNGFIYRLSVTPNSPLTKKSLEDFVSNHWELFLSSPSVHLVEIKDVSRSYENSTARQQFKGFFIRTGYATKQKSCSGRYVSKTIVGFRFNIVDTSLWNFEPKVNLDCDKAVELARTRDEKLGIADGWTYKCQSEEVAIGVHFYSEGPALTWLVAARKKPAVKNQHKFTQPGDESVRLRIIPVDANSGKIHVFSRKVNKVGITPKKGEGWN